VALLDFRHAQRRTRPDFAVLDAVVAIDYRTAMATTVATALAPLTALDEHGQAVALGSFWQVRRAVVSFVRHFG
jgi:hypothetical protein